MNPALTPEERARLEAKFADALGVDLEALLRDFAVCDVMVNADGAVFVERIGEAIEPTAVVIPPARRAAIVKTAAMLGGGQRADGWPMLETRIAQSGWRFAGILPPVVAAPVLSIRKPARALYPLASYVAEQRMSPAACAALTSAVAERRNILVVGGTGSGKTTLANALLAELAAAHPDHRLIVLEDTPELQCASPNHVAMTATHDVTLLDLLRASMRMRPDRIVVGEVRGPEVLVMLSAWNTGHPGGLCTVHADNAVAGLLRLEQLCAQAGVRAGAREEIAQAVQVVVHIERQSGHRRVREVLVLSGLTAAGDYAWTRVA